MYSAIYLPADEKYDPSADGFKSKKSAERYVFSHMCKNCRDERTRALKYKRKGIIDPGDLVTELMSEEEIYDAYEEYGDEWPACACEWLIVETEKLKDCKDLGDMFDAAGFERVKKENEIG